MAVTLAIIRRRTSGATREVVVDFTGPASYTTGGELLTAAQQGQLMPEMGGVQPLDMTKVAFFDAEVEPTNLRSLVLDKTNNKMLFTVAGAQVASLTNLSAVTVRAKLVYAPGGIGT